MSKEKSIKLNKAIKGAYQDARFWAVLLDESSVESGPFDGACLVCAKSIIKAAGAGELVRITRIDEGSNLRSEHYGSMIGGLIYDFDGSADNEEEWVNRFKINESVFYPNMSVSHGLDPHSKIPDDPEAVDKISKIIALYL